MTNTFNFSAAVTILGSSMPLRNSLAIKCSMRPASLFLLLILNMAFPWQASAKEGFLSAPPPRSLMTVWQNTFALLHFNADKKYDNLGTAFVVDKFQRANRNYLLLLTAAHVVDHSQYDIKIFKEVEIEYPQELIPTGTPIHVKIIAADFSKFKDLGFYLIEVDDNIYQERRPLSFSKENCLPPPPPGEIKSSKESFIIGFPATPVRSSYKHDFITEDATHIKKRWSVGFTAAGFPTGNGHNIEKDLQWSTADSLPGASGAPLVDRDGFLLGVNVGGPYDPAGAYKGDERQLGDSAVPRQGHSLFVGCTAAFPYIQEVQKTYDRLIDQKKNL